MTAVQRPIRPRRRHSSIWRPSKPRPSVCGASSLHTPLVAFGPPDARAFLKAESLQPIGAFKLRGAYATIASLPAADLARGVITYSSGNHAQGVARAARLLGAPAVVVMPSDAPAHQASASRRGWRRDRHGRDRERRASRVAERLAAERGLAIIPPYDDDRIIAGQGTVGLEIVADLPDVAAVLVPIGGGGLASGVAVAIRSLRPDARVIGVEPELAADARDSLERGEIVRWPADMVSRTIADGTRTQALGVRTFAHLSAYLDSVITVSEIEIAAGVRLAAERSRLVVEPSGRVAVAALAFHAARPASTTRAVRSSPSRAAGTWTRNATGNTSRHRCRPRADTERVGRLRPRASAELLPPSRLAPFVGQPVREVPLAEAI